MTAIQIPEIFSNRKLVSAVVSSLLQLLDEGSQLSLSFHLMRARSGAQKLIPAAINLISRRGRFYLLTPMLVYFSVSVRADKFPDAYRRDEQEK